MCGEMAVEEFMIAPGTQQRVRWGKEREGRGEGVKEREREREQSEGGSQYKK